VHFGGLYWRSIGGVGYGRVHVVENDSGPDDCNHAQFGAFVLAAPGMAPMGEMEGVRLLHVAPTLLDLGGYDIPSSMQGRSIARDRVQDGSATPGGTLAGEDLVRERLRGLGYIS
jgi:predicted AlkP superfamily phosphohydrolase/phosphomutase